jgi:hypothetical protein
MQGFAPLLEHHAIGHFLGQRVLKDILDLRKRRLFVEKLFALQRCQQSIQLLFRLGDNLSEKAQRKLVSNDG